MPKSILPPEMRGVMFISGYRGVGKSFLASQADIPANVIYVDLEEKGSGIHEQLHFGSYRPLTREVAQEKGEDAGPGDLYPALTDTFSSIEQDRFTVAVIDNIKPLEDAARHAVEADPKKFGVSLSNVRSGRFGGAWPGVHYIVSNLMDILQSRGIRLIIVTAHIRPRWGGAGPIPGKYNLRGVDRWQELSILTLILIHGEFAPIPAALVQKEQLGLIQYDSEAEDFIVKRRLPLRIPSCTFSEIRRYLREPADIRDPQPGEIPTADETSPFDAKLSTEQMAYIMAGVSVEKEMDEIEKRMKEAEKAGRAPRKTVSRQEVGKQQVIEEAAPTTWQELLERTELTLADLGGIVVARSMTGEEIRERWEEEK